MNARRATNSGLSSGGSRSIMRSTMNLCASKPQAVAGGGDDNTTTTRAAARHIYGLSYLLQLLCRPAVGTRARVAVIVEPDADFHPTTLRNAWWGPRLRRSRINLHERKA